MDKRSIESWDGPRHRNPISAERLILPALLATLGWYLLPICVLLLWFLFFATADSTVPRVSVRFVLMAIGLGLALAVPLRLISFGWRPLTVGFVSSVISAGMMTIISTGWHS